MEQHRLLQKQIKKYLTPEYLENPIFSNFIQAINDSYISFERDKEIVNHAFQESEKEYHSINQSLKEEYELKKQSIANLYDGLEAMEDDFEDIQNKDNADDLLFISKYLNRQIEKRRETEKNLVTTVELLKTLLANLQSGILVEDENRNILFTNQLFCDLFSIPAAPDSMIGMDCTDSAEQSKHLFVDSDKFSPRITKILNNRKVVVDELLEMKNGKFLERDYIPIYIKNEYKGHLWKYTDITSRIESKLLLEQSEERNRLIMNSALNAIINIDIHGKIIFWNKQAETIFGWTREEVLGKTLQETIIPNQHKKSHVNGMSHYMKTGEGPALNKQLELPALKKDGTEFPVEIAIIPIKQNNELFFCSFIQDISERKKSENKLKFQEEKYRNIIANMNLGMIEVNNDETILFANQSFCKISGYELDELIGKNPSKLFVFGENVEKIEQKKQLRAEGKSDIYQIPIKNKRGELRWWAISGAPNYDDKGNLIGTIGIHLDITEQKKLEIELENEKLKALEASNAKEAFLANMSHEIRTPLNAIIGFLRELSKQELTDLQKKYIENSSIASKHLLAIINNILDISKIEAGEMSLESEEFILENSINNVITVLHPKATQKQINLYSKNSPSIAKVLKGDALRIEQILFNLVGNSIKFTQKGEININCKLINDYPNSQDISISISDTGIGMDKEFLNSIFRKFSQEDIEVTRKYGGTGLGMAITNELVHLMKGKIEIESEKNVGTTIHIFLHFKKGDISNLKNSHQEATTTSLENISILLVEDNDMNRMVAQNSLQYYNCKVTEAENGMEALEILKKENFDIILMDIQMPEMDGIEATKIIRSEFKLATPIVALTANAFKSEIEKCKKAGMNDYITKPFDEINLIETIAKHTIRKGNVLPKIEKNQKIQKLYNLNSLNNLSRGNKEFVDKMITIFIDQTNITIDKIEVAIANNNFIEVSQLIHKIKPSIEGIGVTSIIDDVKILEKIAKESDDKTQIEAIFLDIKEVLKQVVNQLKDYEITN
ncbi:PAS domain S-box protein [Flavobacterium sp.]|uniref:PAS domain S-box protein n=1 Tax=Flavobacterium sp. TaxID=239 RepID=UPI00260622D5|nr:PAS domain S-box protein [Flavobacterium sp.]